MGFDPFRAAAGSPFVRFCAVGALGFVVDAGLLVLLVAGAGLGPFAARAVSILAAMTTTWLLNRRWTFRPSGRRRLAEWLRYAAANILGACTNYAVYSGVLLLAAEPRLLLAVCVGTGAGLAVNYLGSRYFVFGAPSGTDPVRPPETGTGA